MDKQYKILVIADIYTLESDDVAEEDVYKAAATNLGVSLDDMTEEGEIYLCLEGEERHLDLSNFHYIHRIHAETEADIYQTLLANPLYDDSQVRVEYKTGDITTPLFNLKKDIMENCRLMVHVLKTYNSHLLTEDEFIDVIYDNDDLKENLKVENCEELTAKMSNLGDALNKTYEHTWSNFSAQMKAIMQLPEEIQRSLLETSLHYNEERMEAVKDIISSMEMYDAPKGVTPSSAYSYIMDRFIKNYTEIDD